MYTCCNQPPRDVKWTIGTVSRTTLNVQVVCDVRRSIMSAWTGFPGSCPDAFILHQTALYEKFESSQMPSGWLLGDSGYPQLAWLMAPVRYPQSQAERLYNKAYKKTRSIVETTFGLLKSRLLCLGEKSWTLLRRPGSFLPAVFYTTYGCLEMNPGSLLRIGSLRSGRGQSPEGRVLRQDWLVSRYLASE